MRLPLLLGGNGKAELFGSESKILRNRFTGMKKILQLLGVLLVSFCVMTGNGDATSFLNAPHNEDNSISCKDCHQYPFSAWPGYVQDPANIDDTIRNYICIGCHNGTGSAPLKVLHSSQNTNGRFSPWTTQCVDCHDPHFQAQLQYIATYPQLLFLVTGAYSSVSVDRTDPQNITSLVTYNSPQGDAFWLDPGKWGAKTKPGRGLIFVSDTAQPYYTYEVVSADSSSITLAGCDQAGGNIFQS
jgi:cytochrome c553